jgi:hypothetical protein
MSESEKRCLMFGIRPKCRGRIDERLIAAGRRWKNPTKYCSAACRQHAHRLKESANGENASDQHPSCNGLSGT